MGILELHPSEPKKEMIEISCLRCDNKLIVEIGDSLEDRWCIECQDFTDFIFIKELES